MGSNKPCGDNRSIGQSVGIDPEKGAKYVSYESNEEVGVIEDITLAPNPVSGGPLYRWFMDWQPVGILDQDSNLDPKQREIAAVTTLPLKRRLKNRHLQMIGIGGSIGAGLFISSGTGLQTAGPAGLLLGYFFVGILMFCTMYSISELAVRYPSSGVSSAYPSRFVDRSYGFASGWIYVIGWLTTLPNELIAASVTLKFWEGDHNGATEVNRSAWVALFLGCVIFINVFGVRGYGEAEFIFSSIKVIAVVGFIICGIVIACGGGPNHHYLGGTYWHHPGAFANGAKGVCQSLVSAAYAFSGTEFAGLAAAETANPRKAIPRACKQVFFRILIFYIVSVIVMGCLVRYDDPRLGTTSDASASPFVIGIVNAGIGGLPSVLNVVILLAVLSVANASVFGSTRSLVALAAQGSAPRIFLWIDRQGRPVAALLLSLGFGGLAFISAWDGYGEVFTWLSALGGMSSIWTWGGLNLCALRNRMAMRAHGLGPQDLDWAMPLGYVITTVGFLLATVVICLQFWTSLFPVGWSDSGADHNPADQAKSFFESWLSTTILVILFFGHKIWTRDWSYVKLKDIDLFTGVRIKDPIELRTEIAAERAHLASQHWYVRFYNFWC